MNRSEQLSEWFSHLEYSIIKNYDSVFFRINILCLITSLQEEEQEP